MPPYDSWYPTYSNESSCHPLCNLSTTLFVRRHTLQMPLYECSWCNGWYSTDSNQKSCHPLLHLTPTLFIHILHHIPPPSHPPLHPPPPLTPLIPLSPNPYPSLPPSTLLISPPMEKSTALPRYPIPILHKIFHKIFYQTPFHLSTSPSTFQELR